MKQTSKHQYWQKHIEQSKKFSGSQKNYCEHHGLNHHTFSYWKQKLSSRLNKTKTLTPFVPVTVIEPEKSCRNLPDPEWLARLVLRIASDGGHL